MNLFVLAFIFFANDILHEAEANLSPCGDDSWTPYKDEICVKLFKLFLNRRLAQEFCNEQASISDASIPTLVIIRSAAEQLFLNEYVFNSSMDVPVWIGAERRPNSATEFDWIDGSPVDRFTNWAVGYPTNIVERPCVLMKSRYSRQLSDLEWNDINCNGASWFICQKLQAWSIEQFQSTILSTRRELQHIQANPVPIGFIYVQLSGQPEPRTIWGTVTWAEVTSQYAGLFFRAAGGGSAAFGSVQEDFCPRITNVTLGGGPQLSTAITIPDTGVSPWISTGAATGSTVAHWGLRFNVTGGEVRPRNSAVRIWRRSS